MLMMVLQFSSTCVCWVMKLWKTIWIGKLWLTRTGPCLTHTLSQHGAPSLDMEATSWVKDSSLNDCSILYYNQQCTRYYFGSSPQLSFVRPGRLVVFQACRIFLRSLVCCFVKMMKRFVDLLLFSFVLENQRDGTSFIMFGSKVQKLP